MGVAGNCTFFLLAFLSFSGQFLLALGEERFERASKSGAFVIFFWIFNISYVDHHLFQSFIPSLFPSPLLSNHHFDSPTPTNPLNTSSIREFSPLTLPILMLDKHNNSIVRTLEEVRLVFLLRVGLRVSVSSLRILSSFALLFYKLRIIINPLLILFFFLLLLTYPPYPNTTTPPLLPNKGSLINTYPLLYKINSFYQ